MISDTVNDKLITALAKQAVNLKQPVTDVQLLFSVTREDKMDYHVMLKNIIQSSTSLDKLIGANIYNGIVRGHLKRAVHRAADTIKSLPAETGVIAGTNDGKNITIAVQKDNVIVKQLLLTDII